eukprot:m51a1_g14015 hypothetical protein (212) ;mRNA; f:1097848-1098683
MQQTDSPAKAGAIAICSAMHPRLGECSPARDVGPFVLESIWRSAFPTRLVFDPLLSAASVSADGSTASLRPASGAFAEQWAVCSRAFRNTDIAVWDVLVRNPTPYVAAVGVAGEDFRALDQFTPCPCWWGAQSDSGSLSRVGARLRLDSNKGELVIESLTQHEGLGQLPPTKIAVPAREPLRPVVCVMGKQEYTITLLYHGLCDTDWDWSI